MAAREAAFARSILRAYVVLSLLTLAASPSVKAFDPKPLLIAWSMLRSVVRQDGHRNWQWDEASSRTATGSIMSIPAHTLKMAEPNAARIFTSRRFDETFDTRHFWTSCQHQQCIANYAVGPTDLSSIADALAVARGGTVGHRCCSKGPSDGYLGHVVCDPYRPCQLPHHLLYRSQRRTRSK